MLITMILLFGIVYSLGTNILYSVASQSPGVIIGKNNCDYCVRAITLFKESNIEFTYIPSEKRPEIREAIIDYYDHRTVPCIFLNNTFVGGYNDLNRLLSNKKHS